MIIDYSSLGITFAHKPLLIGGKAMEYYGLRPAGDDIDFIVTSDDLHKLIHRYPHNIKDIWGDLGVQVAGFEIWKSIDHFDYTYLSQGAKEEENYSVISLEKMVLQRAMAMHIPKYHYDLELVIKKMTQLQYADAEKMQQENHLLLAGIDGIQYIEKRGAKEVQ